MAFTLSTVWPTRRVRVVAAGLGATALALFFLVVAGHGEWAERVSERVAKGKKPRIEDYAFQGEWQAALVSTGLCVMLALTARYWLEPSRPVVPAASPGTGLTAKGRGWFWLLMAVLVAAAAWLRAPRMSLSLYNDEEYAFRRYVAGEHKEMPDGSRQWRPVPWLGSLWGNQMANNGVPYSLASRAAYDVAVARGWGTATLPAEVPLRLPALLAGLASVVVIGLLARHVGGVAAGVLAALLAVVHPWHVRYSTEARGHSFVLLLAPLLPLALARAVESGGWRWWALFGAVEVLLLWSFAGSVHYLLAFNFLALIWLWRRGGGVWRTFLAVHVMAAMVYLHLMAPCFPQIREALAENRVFGAGIGASWFANTGSFLFAGMPWSNANPEIASHPSLSGRWQEGWRHVVIPGFFCLMALGVGVVRAWKSPTGRLLVLTLPLAAVLAVAATLVGRTVLFSWYVLYLLPGSLVLAGLGLREWIAPIGSSKKSAILRVMGGGLALVTLLSWGATLVAPLRTYRKMSKQSLREVAQFLRKPIDGVAPLVALHASEANAYDPSLLVIDADPARLQALAAQAEAEGRPLLVAFGYRSVVAQASPEFLRAIEESGEFERVAHFPGLEEPQFAHHVWRRRAKAPVAP